MILDGKVKENILKATALIKNGEVVAFPTETVYGLGCDVFNEAALKKIFEIKKRPFEDPLILHIADVSQLNLVASEIPPAAFKLIEKFWPGPLTLVLKKKPSVPDLATAGLDSVAVRMPRNIIALALIKNSHAVIAAPSANKFQSISPTTAQAVEKELGDSVLVLDGGQSLVGIESTIVSFIKGITVLRLGGIALEDIESCLGHEISVAKKTEKDHQAQIAPGMMDFHYAPKKNLKVLDEQDFKTVLEKSADKNHSAILSFGNENFEIIETLGFKKCYSLSRTSNFKEAAKNYFQILRDLDESDAKNIFCISLPEQDLGRAINDRLRKAQHK